MIRLEPAGAEALLLVRAEAPDADLPLRIAALAERIHLQLGELLTAVMRAVARFNPQLSLMLLARRNNSEAEQLAAEQGIGLLFEAFADRGYDPDGYLLPRNQPGAVHHDPERILAQALTFARGEPITASDGSQLTLRADSLCVHGDNAESLAVLRRLRAQLDAL